MNIKDTIPAVFEEYVRRFPDHVAVIENTESLTYAELNQQSNQLAHYLISQGIQLDKPIAICLERSTEFLIALLAILKAGGAYLPLDPQQPEERLLFMLEDSECTHVITQDTCNSKLSRYQGQVIMLDHNKKIVQRFSTTNPNLKLTSNQLAYVIYTSGSTGHPKGVLIEHHSVINYSQWFADYTACEAQQHIDFSSNPIFDMAVSVTTVSLLLGLTIIICSDKIKKNTKLYLEYLAESHINIIKITPSYFKVLLQEIDTSFVALPHLQSIILGGENLDSSVCKEWLTHYPQQHLFNEYGPTETTVAISVFKIDATNSNNLSTNVPIGQVGNKMTALIVDNNNNAVAPGQEGELVIGGICVARGYLHREDLTKTKFIHLLKAGEIPKRYYKTGDLCTINHYGVLEYHGRIDDQVKIRGFRIEPAEIEQFLGLHPQINAVTVVPRKNNSGELLLVAYYIENNTFSDPITSQLLRQFLKTHVPEYMIPSAFVKVDFFPLTANGKLDKNCLPLPQFDSKINYIKPISQHELQLTAIWEQELGVSPIGLNDNFFELGGHSLTSARIVLLINHHFKKCISLQDFYNAGCISQLIKVVNQSPNTTAAQLDEHHFKSITHAPLSDFQFVLWIANTFEPKAKKINIVARKRILGRLDSNALKGALESVLKKHEVLRYKVSKYQPVQKIQSNLFATVDEKYIDQLPPQEQYQELEFSLSCLSAIHPWPKNHPLIMVKLFHLNKDTSELQISIPHLVSDDASIEILMNDLSYYYMRYKTKILDNLNNFDLYYKKYTVHERHTIETSVDKGIKFWEKYLQDTSFFAFPEHYIVKNMDTTQHSYSTYTEIPESAFKKIKYFCLANHLSIMHGLCAVLSLALRNCSQHDTEESTSYKVINIIKSTRDNPVYDHSIGCFLRVEPVRIAMDAESNLSILSKQIHQSSIDTSNYQQCSNLIKFSAVSSLGIQRKKLKNILLNLMITLSTRILRIPKVYRKILKNSLARLMFFKRKSHFIVNLNVRNNFLTESNKQTTLFGLQTSATENYQHDLLAIDYVFEACFYYDDDQKKHFLVISANLVSEFRIQIAQEILRIINCSMLEREKKMVAV